MKAADRICPDPLSSRRGSALALLLVVVAVAAVGFIVWREYSRRQADFEARNAAIRKHNEEVRLRLLKEAEEERLAQEAAKKKPETVTNDVVEVEEQKPVERPAEEVWREDLAAWKSAFADIEAARAKAEKPLNGLGGIKFGEPLQAAPVRWGAIRRLLDAASVETNGVTFAVYGPKFSKSFLSFGQQPLVWVTPRTRKVFRIELSRPVKAAAGTMHDPETEKAVEELRKRFSCEPITLFPARPGRPGCEYVFPMKETTVKVGEYKGQLMLAVEHETYLEEALAESADLREARRGVVDDRGVLGSTRYPHRPIDRRRYRVKFKDGTPESFCGVVFGSRPPENATIENPQQGEKGFFLDYEKAKCKPFIGFNRGRADVDRWRGGVFAVNLYSEGGAGGLDDHDYYARVRNTLKEHYKVEPQVEGTTNEFPTLTYAVGDVTIKLGPGVRGGFFLRAENSVLASLAQVDPYAKKSKKR